MKKMKFKSFLLALAIAFSTALLAQTTELNIMTFNLRFGELASLEQMAEYISSQQPDIVALQECDWKTNNE